MAVMTASELAEITTVAELEIFGLSVRTINILERADYLMLVDLERLTEGRLRCIFGINELAVRELREALERYCAGDPVYTVEECVHGDFHR